MYKSSLVSIVQGLRVRVRRVVMALITAIIGRSSVAFAAGIGSET